MHKPSGTELHPPGRTVRIGAWQVDPRADEIAADGRVVKLEPLKMRVLLALAARPGEVLLTQELLDSVWAGLIVTPASVYQGVAQLRRLLGDDASAPRYIETVPRKGYRLVAKVQWLTRETGAGTEVAGSPTEAPVPVPAATSTTAPDSDETAAEPRAPPPAEPRPAQARPAHPAPAQPESARPLPATAEAGAAGQSAPGAAVAPPPWRPARRRLLIGAGAAAAAVAVLGTALWRRSEPGSPPGRVRLAVLPFADRSRGGAEQALSEGLALDVIRAFERYPQVDVVAGESALLAGDGGHRLEAVAERLQVGLLMLGELMRTGTQVRLAVRLQAWPGGRLRWQREFEQTLASVALLPEAIAAEAAGALRLARPQPQRAGPSEAYEFYVLGQNAWRAQTPEAFDKARDYFERGIDIDPAFARNYIGLGWTWIAQANYGAGIDTDAAYARATPLFDKALRLDPESAEALTAQGVLAIAGLRYGEARARFDQALQRNPSYAQAHLSYGIAELNDGWPRRAAPHFRRTAELNPLAISPQHDLGMAACQAGRFAEAESALRRCIELDPGHPNGHAGLGANGYAQGMLDAAVQHYREALQREPRRPFLWYELAWLYLDLGLPDLAAQAFGQTAARLPPTSRWTGVHSAYAWLARPDRGPAPAALALDPEQVPDDFSAIDLMLLRTLAGLSADAGLLQRALDAMQSVRYRLESLSWFVFQGRNALVDLATVELALGRPERAAPWLDQAERQLERYRTQQNVWHALHFHRARIHGLRGDAKAAAAALVAAVEGGCRRGWWLRLDPAFAALRERPDFQSAIARVDADMARQRAMVTG